MKGVIKERRVRFKVLGPLEVERDGERLNLGGPKQRAVLAVLLLEANRVVPAADIVDHVWGDGSGERTSNTLQVYISNLRKLLDPGASAAASRLRTQAPGYLLAVGDDELDLLEFQREVASAREIAGLHRPDQAAAMFRGALALWRGEPLSDLDGELIAPMTVRISELRIAALEDRIAADLAAGRHAEVITDLEGLIRDHPYRERPRAQHMLALYRSGRQAEALQSYQQTRELLLDELGIDPGAELQDLERAILRQDPALNPERRSNRRAFDTTMDLGGYDAPTARTSTGDLELGLLELPDGERHVLGRYPCTIGRSIEGTITLLDANVSRRHAIIRLVDGAFVLTDLGSTNGTLVNGEAVTHHTLVAGDQVQLGDTIITFRTLAS